MKVLLSILIIVGLVYITESSLAQTPDSPRNQKLVQDILNDMRVISAAKKQYVLENNSPAGSKIGWLDVRMYMKPTSRLGMLDAPTDYLGQPIEIGVAGLEPAFSPRSVELLTKIQKVDFADKQWEQFVPETTATSTK